jgi:hypothetical protein
MNTHPRQLPRFLPTLTEVVRPSELTVEKTSSPPDSEALVQAVMARLDALIKTRVHQELESLVRSVIDERSATLGSDLKVELYAEVRELVSEVVATQNEENKFKS